MEAGQILIEKQLGGASRDEKHFIQGLGLQELNKWLPKKRSDTGRVNVSRCAPCPCDSIYAHHSPMGVNGDQASKCNPKAVQPSMGQVDILVGENKYIMDRLENAGIVGFARGREAVLRDNLTAAVKVRRCQQITLEDPLVVDSHDQ